MLKNAAVLPGEQMREVARQSIPGTVTSPPPPLGQRTEPPCVAVRSGIGTGILQHTELVLHLHGVLYALQIQSGAPGSKATAWGPSWRGRRCGRRRMCSPAGAAADGGHGQLRRGG